MSDIVAVRKDIGVIRGDNGDWEGTVLDVNDNQVNINSAEIRFTVKANRKWDDSRAAITKKNTAAGGDDAQIDITDGPNGVYQVHVLPADTVGKAPGVYWYDVQVKISDRVGTPVYGTFTIELDVTITA